MDRPLDSDLAARLFGGKPEHTLALLKAAWPGAVGAELARRTEVVALDRGVLRVKVPDLRWQRNLLRMRGDILSRLRRVAGRAAPRAIGFVTGSVMDRGDPPPAPPAEAPAPTPPPAPAAVATAAGAIPDPEIRAQFLRTRMCRAGGMPALHLGCTKWGGIRKNTEFLLTLGLIWSKV